MKTIPELRLERGWKQIDLAVKLGVALSTISNWETGSTEPSASQFRKLAELFGVSMDIIELPPLKKAAA